MDETIPYHAIRWQVLLSVGLSSVCSGLTIMSFAPLIGEIAKDLRVDLGTASFCLLGLTTFVSAVGIASLGFVIDRVGIFPILIASQLLIFLCSAAIPLVSNHFEALVLLRMLQGLGAGGLTVAITPALAQSFAQHELGRALGGQAVGMPIGIMLGLNTAPLLAKVFGGWQLGIGALAVVPAIACLVTIFTAWRSVRFQALTRSFHRPGEGVRVRDFIRLPAFWVGLIALGLCDWVGISFTSLSPGYLAVDPPVGAGFGPQGAGNLMLIFTLSAAAGPLLGGYLIDKLFEGHGRPIIVIGWVLSILCYTSILSSALHHNQLVLMLVLSVAGFANPFINVTLMSYAAKVFDRSIVGRVCGLWLSLSFLAGSAGVMVCSFALRTTGNYMAPSVIIGVMSVLGLFMTPLLKRPTPTLALDV